MPRDVLRPLVAPGAEPGGTVIRRESALGRILATYLHATWRNLAGLSAAEVGSVRQALLGVLAAGLKSSADAPAGDPGAPLAPATLDAMRLHIESHLGSRELSPDQICRTFHCSRSYLYRLFEPVGGVACFIRERRLQRSYRELARTGSSPHGVGDLAARFGFTNHSHFTRLFKQTFGLSPTQVMRQAGQARAVPAGSTPGLPAYRHWLLNL